MRINVYSRLTEETAPVTQNELLEAAKMAREALASCYNVIEYPANGKTSQDRAIALLDLAIRNAEQAQGTPTP